MGIRPAPARETGVHGDRTLALIGVRLLLVAVFALSGTAGSADPPAAPRLPGLDAQSVESHLAAGEAAPALALVEAALDRASRDGGAPVDLAAAVEALAQRFYEAGATAEAETLFRRALALREAVPGGDPAGFAGALHALSGVCFNRGAYAEAEALERRALEVGERALPPGDLAVALSRRDLGFIYLTEGRLGEAEPLLVGAVCALETVAGGGPYEVSVGRNYLSELYRVQGRYAEAAALLERLVETSERELGTDDPQTHYFINNLAGIYRDQDRFAEAEVLLHRSLALRRSAAHPDEGAIARGTLNLAELYRFQGKLDDAEPLYTEALARAERAYGAENPELFEFVNQAAVLQRERGRLDRAEPLARRALALATAALGPDDPRIGQSELDLGELLRAAGRCEEAASHYERARAIRETAYGTDHPEVAAVIVARAPCALPRDSAAARADLDRAIEILSRTVASPGVEIDALALRADLRRASDPGGAKVDLEAALRVVEELRPRRGGGEEVRADFLGRHAELYQRMVRWQIADGHVARALEWAERSRARSLLDQLAAGGVGAAQVAQAESGDRLAAARAKVAELRQRLGFLDSAAPSDSGTRSGERREVEVRLEAAMRDLRGIYDEARNASPAWRLATIDPATAEEVQRTAVPSNGLLLQYAIGEDASYLFLVPPLPAPPELFELRLDAAAAGVLGVSKGPANGPSLERALLGGEHLRGQLELLGAPPLGPTRGIGGLGPSGALPVEGLGALFRTLVPSAAWQRIRTAREVVVVPDGALALLPFEALVVGVEASGAARFWLDDGPPVRYAPSGTLLREIAKRVPPSGSGALSVFDPAYGDLTPLPALGRLPELPGTTAEARRVRAALSGVAEVASLEGVAATESAVRAALAGKRWIHLATHGLVDERKGDLFAALAFALPASALARGDDDGLLELREIYDLKLDCDLAVLSACRSNAGREVAGEGVFALSRAFLAAGARRVVASQWSVADDSAAELVGDLFSEVAASARAGRPLDYAVALRDAKRRMRARPEFSHPFHWAAFVLTGAG